MRSLTLLALVPIVMWLGQSALVLRAGLPVRFRISSADLPRRFKRINRVMTYAAFALVLLAYPLLQGASPFSYYARFLPLGPQPLQALFGAAAALLYLTLLYLAWTATGNVHFEIRHARGRLIRRLASAPLTAVFIAFVEELLFRAMLLDDLLHSFAPATAMTLGVLIFAGAHYIRSVKRYWTFPGHVALGLLFCTAFYCTGTLWLSLGLHAGGVLLLSTIRPFVRYSGPPWLVGASIFPYAGAPGIAALLLLSANIWLTFGGPP